MSDGSDIDGRDEASNGTGGANGLLSWLIAGRLRLCRFRWQTMHSVTSSAEAHAPSEMNSTDDAGVSSTCFSVPVAQ